MAAMVCLVLGTTTASASWIRTSGAFGGVIDFAVATADPADPTALDPAFDSGDHLHPNDAGTQATANAIDLRALLRESKSTYHGSPRSLTGR